MSGMPPTAAGLATEVARLAGPAFRPDTPLALAVSGGADSLALLALGAEAFGDRALVLSVDHGLRAASAGECAMVAARAAECGLPHQTLTLALGPGGDIQARARTARYAAMARACAEHGIALLLTAHHADDQAETLLMRLARGSGVGGLAGIRPLSRIDGLMVLRPLLGVRRASLAEIPAARGWTAVDDPSNRDPRFDRSRARALLAVGDWPDPARLAASAACLAEAEDALHWAATRAFETRHEWRPPELRLDPGDLPDELGRRLLAQGLAAFGHRADGPALTRLIERLKAGGPGTLGPVRVMARDGLWRLTPAPPRRRGGQD